MKVIFYTDGSTRPTNPGFSGFGVFGYLFKDAPRPKNTKHPIKTKLNFTDQGLKEEKSPNPIEVVRIYEYIRAINNPRSTNNDAEIRAAMFAMQKALTIEDLQEATIITDSEYVVKGFNEHLTKWVVNGFRRIDGKPVSYIDEWSEINLIRQAAIDKGLKLRVEWIKGHSDDYGNQVADLYSVVGMNAARVQYAESGLGIPENFIEDVYSCDNTYAEYKASYDNKDFIYHFKNLFFSSAPLSDENYCFISSNEDELEVGKRDNTTIFLANHGYVPEFINKIKAFFRSLPRTYIAPCSIKLSRLENRDMLRLGDKVDVRFLLAAVPNSRKNAYSLVCSATDTSSVFIQENTMEFPFIATVDRINHLLSTPDLSALDKVQVWDVTDTFVKNGKLALSNKDKFVDFTYLTEGQLVLTQRLIASVGSDIPSYLALKKIESEIQKVEVVLQGSPNNNLYTLFVRIITGNRQMYSLNVVNKYLAVPVNP